MPAISASRKQGVEPVATFFFPTIPQCLATMARCSTLHTSSSTYIMAREAVYIRIILEELGHKQPPTPLQTDNAMAEAVINGKVQPKRTKAMDMRFHWLRDRECQEQFRIYWRPGKLNYADYWTKHHAATHHQNVRKEFLTPYIVLEMLQQEQSIAAAAAA